MRVLAPAGKLRTATRSTTLQSSWWQRADGEPAAEVGAPEASGAGGGSTPGKGQRHKQEDQRRAGQRVLRDAAYVAGGYCRTDGLLR
jgi:hypothetical protein